MRLEVQKIIVSRVHCPQTGRSADPAFCYLCEDYKEVAENYVDCGYEGLEENSIAAGVSAIEKESD